MTLPQRWVVERTFGRMMRRPRLVHHFDHRVDVYRQMINVAQAAFFLNNSKVDPEFETLI